MATIPFADVLDWQPLPIDAQDVVTKVRLVVAGNRAGSELTRLRSMQEAGSFPSFAEVTDLSYAPWPIVYEFEAPEHAIYHAERSFALPSGVNPFLPPADIRIPEPVVSRFDNPGDPSVVRDGDPETFAEFTGAADDTAYISYPATPGNGFLGFKLRYSLGTSANPSGRGVQVLMAYIVMGQPPRDETDWFEVHAFLDRLPDVESQEIYCVLPPEARWAPVNQAFPLEERGMLLQFRINGDQTVDACTVTEFYPLVLNEPLLLDIARQQLRLPAVLPQRVTVRGVIPPDREHTITGWPGGDYTGAVAQAQYDLGRTVIDFEQASAPVGLPAEAMEAARERRNATDAVVQTANYNLKMGIRG